MTSETLEDMLDSFKIRRVIERYCRGVDRGDAELISSVYWPEATDNHGIWKGPGNEFGAFIVPMMAEAYTQSMHCVAQSNIAVSGTSAAADTYCIAMHRKDHGDKVTCDYAYCRYVDRFEKRGEEWRILDRVVVMEAFQGFADAEAGPSPIETFALGRTDRSDLSYQAYERAGVALI